MSETTATPADITPKAPEPAAATPKPDELPADHPLVKSLAAQKDEIRALKEKAARLDQIEEANKSEAQKLTERVAAAERTASESVAKVLRRDVALEHKLTKEDAAMLDTITDEDAMRALAARLATVEDDGKPRNPRPDPNQGRPAHVGTTPGDLFASALSQAIKN